jgi:hypothetical protein
MKQMLQKKNYKQMLFRELKYEYIWSFQIWNEMKNIFEYSDQHSLQYNSDIQ